MRLPRLESEASCPQEKRRGDAMTFAYTERDSFEWLVRAVQTKQRYQQTGAFKKPAWWDKRRAAQGPALQLAFDFEAADQVGD
jgi:hypothetical protein